MTLTRPRPRALLALGLAGALLLSLLVTANASSHREAPLIAEDPVADNTDVYAFVSPDNPDTVTLIANWIPLQNPSGGPTFYNFGEDVRYEINVDSNGDAIDDVSYYFRFDTKVRTPGSPLYINGPVTSLNDPDFNLYQTYSVTEVRGGTSRVIGTNLPVPPNNVGPRSTPIQAYEEITANSIRTLNNGVKVFAGQRDEAFFLDLGSIFDLGGLRPFNNAHDIPLPVAPGKPSTNGFNVHSIALQVPKSQLLQRDQSPRQPVLGVYSSTSRQQTRVFANGNGARPVYSGPFVQISRLGHPLINEIIIPLADKDNFNASEPRQDAQFLKYVQRPFIGRVIGDLYSSAFRCYPTEPRNDLVTIYLTGIPDLNQVPGGTPNEMLRLNVDIPPTPPGQQNRLGVLGGDLDGFPNGRRLGDDDVDIALRAVAGATPVGQCNGRSPNQDLADGVNANDRPTSTPGPQLPRFPYIPQPWDGYTKAGGVSS